MTKTPIKALIADDSSTICRLVERALRKTGRRFQFTIATDGQQAIEALAKTAFDIAFLDINMPQMSGIDVMESIHEAGSKTFAISMSDKLSEDAEQKLKAFGAYDFLSKPFSPEQVQQIIQTYEALKANYDILIVDDSATVRKIVEKVLQRSIFNLDIDHAHNGASAIEAIQNKSYRIIFTDFNMPGMSGIELAEKIQTFRQGGDVIVMSTEMNETLDKAAQRVGARAFLRKPFYPEDVDSILHHLFQLRHSHFSKQVRMFAMA
ncbi:MAG: response regulator [Rhodobacteraceae bacterium]|nr:response regulator [Paracoccaceae bacterium]